MWSEQQNHRRQEKAHGLWLALLLIEALGKADDSDFYEPFLPALAVGHGSRKLSRQNLKFKINFKLLGEYLNRELRHARRTINRAVSVVGFGEKCPGSSNRKSKKRRIVTGTSEQAATGPAAWSLSALSGENGNGTMAHQ